MSDRKNMPSEWHDMYLFLILWVICRMQKILSFKQFIKWSVAVKGVEKQMLRELCMTHVIQKILGDGEGKITRNLALLVWK